jgi:glycerol-3-phosphate dehydrogenase
MNEDFDIAIVGAGIHGAGIAQAAAAAGHRVLVLEQTDVASGTSSRSSKLIHGGLRYLEHGNLALVRECLRERQLLLKLAPDLVRLRPFHIPVYRYTTRRPWQLRAGLSIYSLLGGLGSRTRFRSLPRQVWESLDGLRTDELQSVFQYWDAQTDDGALTRAVMRSAQSLGAELKMPARFLHAELDEQGVSLLFTSDGREQSCRCNVLVNAAGPWVNQVAGGIAALCSELAIDLVQGTHLAFDARLGENIYYLEVPDDGRMVFVMPWRGITLVGTTETLFEGNDPGAVAPLPSERAYLRQVFSYYFPQTALNEVTAFAGLRVLPQDSRRPFDRGRELVLSSDRRPRPRILSVYGGKLTSYRADALKVMARLRGSLPARNPLADTARLRLSADT